MDEEVDQELGRGNLGKTSVDEEVEQELWGGN